MEVMSSLLFLVLALLPQVLGRYSQSDSNQDIKKYSKMVLVDETNHRHLVFLNTNGKQVKHGHKSNSIDGVLSDYSCTKCFKCMAKAVAAAKNTPLPQNLNAIANHRDKRSARASEGKSKSKKSKSKLITVTKYNYNGLLHAIKVKETYNELTTCEVFAVTKSYSCDSPEVEHMLSVSTISKKNKPDKGSKNKKQTPEYQVDPNTTAAPPTEPTVIKREVDNSQVPIHDNANVALSFEEYF